MCLVTHGTHPFWPSKEVLPPLKKKLLRTSNDHRMIGECVDERRNLKEL